MRYYTVIEVRRCFVRVAVVSAVMSFLVLVKTNLKQPIGQERIPSQTATLKPPTSQLCREMFTVDKGSPDTVWYSDSPYAELSHELLPLLARLDERANDTAEAAMFLGTRLQLMNGTIPYLPCKVGTFGTAEVDRCVAARANHGTNTWIAFVGDSTQRQKIHTFMSFLPPGLDYTYYLGSREVSRKEFILAVAHHKLRPPTFDIIGRRPTTTSPDNSKPPKNNINSLSDNPNQDNNNKDRDVPDTPPNTAKDYPHFGDSSNPDIPKEEDNTNPFFEVPDEENPKPFSVDIDDHYIPLWEDEVVPRPYQLRVTVVWATGTTMGNKTTRSEVAKLEEWLTGGSSLPHAVVVGLGTWSILKRDQQDELAPFSSLEAAVRPLLSPLTRLAARTRVLYWAQSRYRWFNYNGDKVLTLNHMTSKKFWFIALYLNQFNDSIPLVDGWVWRMLRGTGAWHWDSTLPFNLANLRECQMLTQARLFSHPLFTGRWWNCNDIHHSSYETNSDEIQMLFNLVCNRHIDTHEQHCCSEE